jgi:hypothetical protein
MTIILIAARSLVFLLACLVSGQLGLGVADMVAELSGSRHWFSYIAFPLMFVFAGISAFLAASTRLRPRGPEMIAGGIGYAVVGALTNRGSLLEAAIGALVCGIIAGFMALGIWFMPALPPAEPKPVKVKPVKIKTIVEKPVVVREVVAKPSKVKPVRTQPPPLKVPPPVRDPAAIAAERVRERLNALAAAANTGK